jgi:hypothetical protein
MELIRDGSMIGAAGLIGLPEIRGGALNRDTHIHGPPLNIPWAISSDRYSADPTLRDIPLFF